MSVDWYPVIDKELCTECLICYDFCQHDVYALEDGRPAVVRPENCIAKCHGCERQCPAGAISYFGDDKKGRPVRIVF